MNNYSLALFQKIYHKEFPVFLTLGVFVFILGESVTRTQSAHVRLLSCVCSSEVT